MEFVVLERLRYSSARCLCGTLVVIAPHMVGRGVMRNVPSNLRSDANSPWRIGVSHPLPTSLFPAYFLSKFALRNSKSAEWQSIQHLHISFILNISYLHLAPCTLISIVQCLELIATLNKTQRYGAQINGVQSSRWCYWVGRKERPYSRPLKDQSSRFAGI